MIKFKNITIVLLLIVFLLPTYNQLYSQAMENYPDSINKKRLNTVIYTSAGLYTATLGVLYLAWYKNEDLGSFHWINDNGAWLKVDKIGHATTAYTMSNYGYWSLRWAGLNNNRAAIYGGIMGWTAMTVIEIQDGFSEGWGASAGDLYANAIGSVFFVGQQLLWKEQRLRLKFSYHPTEYADYRPDLLGENGLQRIIKDYNGQTYWFSANIHSFLREESKFPKWINVSFGYGAKGMQGSNSNPTEHEGQPLPYYPRVSQYYFSMDIDWTKINTNSSLLRFIFKGLSFVKAPMPTIEYNRENNFVFHWLFF